MQPLSPQPYRITRERPPVLRYLIPIILLLLVGLFAISRMMRPRPDTVSTVQAQLSVLVPPVEIRTTPDGAWTTVTGDTAVAEGTRIRTGPSGRAELVLANGSVVRMQTASELAVQTLPTERRAEASLELTAGEVWSRLVNLGARGSYQLDAGQALALVRGTAFSASKTADALTVAAVHHDVILQLADDGPSVNITESRQSTLAITDPALRTAQTLPTVAQDLAFLGSPWRRTNLEADVLYLTRLAVKRPELADEARAAAAHARCLLDLNDCEGGTTVRDIRITRAGNTATAVLELSAWDGRPVRVIWKLDGAIVRETDLQPRPGDLLTEDRYAVKAAGTYTVEAVVSGIVLKSVPFTVDALAEEPSSAPTTPPAPGECRAYDASAFCGTRQYYVDKDGDCVYEGCVTCSGGRVGVDADDNGFAETCGTAPAASSAPASSAPAPKPSSTPKPSSAPVSSQPASSSPICRDPGTCLYGYDAAACSCKLAPQPVCGDAACNGTETCTSCARDCGVCPVTAVCGNGKLETGEQCEPAGTATCDSSCRTIIAPPVAFCGDGLVNGNEQCEPPNTRSCDAKCQTIIPQQPSSPVAVAV